MRYAQVLTGYLARTYDPTIRPSVAGRARGRIPDDCGSDPRLVAYDGERLPLWRSAVEPGREDAVDDRPFIRLLDIVRAASVDARGATAFTPGDFCYRWYSETSPEATPTFRIWQTAGGYDRGFAWLSGEQLHLVMRSSDTDLAQDMLAWGERALATAKPGGSVRVMTGARSALRELLAERGYRQGELTLIHRARSPLDIPLPSPLPTDCRILDRDEELPHAAWAAAYRSAFAPEPMLAEVRRRMTGCPLYRRDLDLGVVEPDGRVAAFALAWFDPVTGSGTFEPIGCVPAWQRMGLSSALLCEGLARLGALGATRVWISTSRARVAPNALYRSLKFQEFSRSDEWIATP